MAQNSWPSPGHNDRAVTDTEYEKLASRFSDNGVYGDPTDTAVVTPGAGLSVNVRAEVYGSLRGHAWYSGTTAVNLTIAANSSGSTRTDRVVLRLDRSTWTVRAVVRQGTPGGGVPTLTQQTGDTGFYEILLANVTLLNGAGSVTVTRGERYVGTRVRPTVSTNLIDPSPTLGEIRFKTDTGTLHIYDGSTEKTIFSDSGNLVIDSPLAAWETSVASTLEERNGNVHIRLGTWERKGSTLQGTTDARLPLLIPSAYRHPNRNQYAMAYITGARIGRVTIYSANESKAGQVWLTQKPDISAGQVVLPGSVSWVV